MHSLPPDVSHPLRTAPCLLDVVRERIRARHYSPRTERAYVGWIRRFILFHNKRHPRDMGESEVVAFLSALATTGHVSASTQNQALSALVFLYSEVIGNELDWLGGLVRARRPARIPVVLTRQEVQALLSQLTGSVSLMASLLYGAGLRLLECAELRVKDVDFEAGEIRVRDGKGRKDRVTMVPASLVGALRQHLERVKALHEKFPIPDRGVPASRESVASLASDIVDALDTGKNVAVHCRQGIGRSGLIVGGVLMAAGKELGAALKAIRESRGLEIPETEEQRRWLSDFASWLVSTQAAQQAAAADERRSGVRSKSGRS